MENYYELFGVNPGILRKIMEVALSKGGDYSDIYFEYTTQNELVLRDGEVNAVVGTIDYGVGIRVVSKGKTGYAFAESTSLDEMLRAAATAAQIADSPSYAQVPINVTNLQNGPFYPILQPWENHSITEKKEYLMEMKELVFQADKRVIKVIGKISDSNTKVLFFNSLGELFTDERPMASLNVTCIMEENQRVENYSSSKSYRMGFEFLSKELIKEVAATAVEGCAGLFKATQPSAGEMAVVMGEGSSGILLHEAIGHAFEADFIRKKTSIFSDKLGKQICRKGINVVDDATIMHNRGSLNYDDEGVPGQKTYMVKDGILNSFLHDRISAAHFKTAPTGNGRRESFRFMPIPRMRATYMESGNCKKEDLIESVKRGIYVDNFSNGQVQIGAGDFTFFVKTGYEIENGKLTHPIKDTNIIGNGPETLANILEVADNCVIDDSTWICGKEQNCPVSCGMPAVLISKLNVGGIN